MLAKSATENGVVVPVCRREVGVAHGKLVPGEEPACTLGDEEACSLALGGVANI